MAASPPTWLTQAVRKSRCLCEACIMSTATEIDVKELLAKIDSGRRPTLLDVRNDDEFGNWKIEGRAGFEIIHVPYFDFIEDEQAAIERVPAHEVVVSAPKEVRLKWLQTSCEVRASRRATSSAE